MQVKGGSHCPVGVMRASLRTGYCLTLESAGLAAKLPFSQAALWEKMSGNLISILKCKILIYVIFNTICPLAVTNIDDMVDYIYSLSSMISLNSVPKQVIKDILMEIKASAFLCCHCPKYLC